MREDLELCEVIEIISKTFYMPIDELEKEYKEQIHEFDLETSMTACVSQYRFIKVINVVIDTSYEIKFDKDKNTIPDKYYVDVDILDYCENTIRFSLSSKLFVDAPKIMQDIKFKEFKDSMKEKV